MITKLAYIFEARSNVFSPPLTMPTPELKKLPSKDSSEGSPHASSDVNPAIADPNASKRSIAMTEAWNAANAELPQARGVEKFLNRVGTLIASVLQGLCADT